MQDFNFFEPYVVHHKRKEKRKMTFYSITALLIAAILSFPLFSQVYSHNVKKDVEAMKRILESSEAKDKVERLEEKQAELNEIKNIMSILQDRDTELKKIDIVNEQLIQTIADAVPKDLHLESVTISNGEISLYGKAKEKSSIAELEYRLRKANQFNNIFIPSITSNEELFDFYLQFTVKDVN